MKNGKPLPEIPGPPISYFQGAKGRASCPGDQVKKRKTRLRAWFGFPLTFALFARDRPATPPARPRKFSKKYRVPRGPRALLSETATPAILRTFRTSSVTLNQSHPIFRVFFVFIADFSDQTSKKRKNVIYNMLSLL